VRGDLAGAILGIGDGVLPDVLFASVGTVAKV
jgi:hypothetical protein